MAARKEKGRRSWMAIPLLRLNPPLRLRTPTFLVLDHPRNSLLSFLHALKRSTLGVTPTSLRGPSLLSSILSRLLLGHPILIWGTPAWAGHVSYLRPLRGTHFVYTR